MDTVKTNHYRDYLQFLATEFKVEYSSYTEYHNWSINFSSEFWETISKYFKIEFDQPYSKVQNENNHPWKTEWFLDSKLNYAKHIFRNYNAERPALIYQSETTVLIEISWQELLDQTLSLQEKLVDLGVQQGDVVAAYGPSTPATVAAFLACNSLGAIWSSCSPDFGIEAVCDRFIQLAPKVLFSYSSYTHNGKKYNSSKKVEHLKKILGEACETISLEEYHVFKNNTRGLEELSFTPVDFSAPIWILFSSGTTGKPKAIVHKTGAMLLEHLKALGLHQNVCPGDRYFWYSTTGWIMWNYALSILLCGESLCIYNGAVNYPNQNVLWDFAARAGINHFGHGASYYQALFKNNLFSVKSSELVLKTLGSTGSPLDAATTVKLQNTFPKTQIISLSGGTDVCTAFVGGHPELEVKPGEIQCKMLGAPVSIYDQNANKVIDTPGELVLEGSFIALPKALWGDDDFSQYKKSYYSMYKNVWNHGDWATETKSGGFIIHGRSDATLNRSGVRIGTGEFYALFDKRKDIDDSLIIHLLKQGEDALHLFLKANSKIDLNELKRHIRKNCSPRHVPDYIHLVPDIPYTISGKKVEIPIKKLLSGISLDKALSKESLRNPEGLEWFKEFVLNDNSSLTN